MLPEILLRRIVTTEALHSPLHASEGEPSSGTHLDTGCSTVAAPVLSHEPIQHSLMTTVSETSNMLTSSSYNVRILFKPITQTEQDI